jgi:hypothetical protein
MKGIRTQMGTNNTSEMEAVPGMPCTTPPRKSKELALHLPEGTEKNCKNPVSK